jgi:predicted ArsR family transcriptional regulator
MTNITQEELLEALYAAATGHGSDDARTAGELAAESGMSIGAVRNALKAVAKEGRLRTCRVRRTMVDGRPTLVPGYVIQAAP